MLQRVKHTISVTIQLTCSLTLRFHNKVFIDTSNTGINVNLLSTVLHIRQYTFVILCVQEIPINTIVTSDTFLIPIILNTISYFLRI